MTTIPSSIFNCAGMPRPYKSYGLGPWSCSKLQAEYILEPNGICRLCDGHYNDPHTHLTDVHGWQGCTFAHTQYQTSFRRHLSQVHNVNLTTATNLEFVFQLGDTDLDKRHVCRDCERQYKNIESFQRHNRHYHGGTRHPCHIKDCDEVFSSVDNLRIHVIRFHQLKVMQEKVRKPLWVGDIATHPLTVAEFELPQETPQDFIKQHEDQIISPALRFMYSMAMR